MDFDVRYLKCIERRKGQTAAKIILQEGVEEPAVSPVEAMT